MTRDRDQDRDHRKTEKGRRTVEVELQLELGSGSREIVFCILVLTPPPHICQSLNILVVITKPIPYHHHT